MHSLAGRGVRVRTYLRTSLRAIKPTSYLLTIYHVLPVQGNHRYSIVLDRVPTAGIVAVSIPWRRHDQNPEVNIFSSHLTETCELQRAPDMEQVYTALCAMHFGVIRANQPLALFKSPAITRLLDDYNDCSLLSS